MKNLLLSAILIGSTVSVSAQSPVNKIYNDDLLRNGRQEIAMPDILGYKTLKGDFHIHTIYSDGQVKPETRIHEAYNLGLDVIAITDHQIQQQNIGKVPFDDNTSYELAKKEAANYPLILIKGTEITYGKEDGGHMNALFIKDANPINKPSMAEAVDAAFAQGAFLIWNHPGWAIDTCKFFPPNEKWMKEGKIHGVEVFNEKEFYPRAVTWARDYGWAPFANTDIHDAMYNKYIKRPPYNLIFAETADLDGVRNAMFGKRMVAVFNDQMAGDAKYLEALFKASVKFSKTHSDNNYVWYEATNKSDMPYIIRSRNFNLNIPANASVRFNFDKGIKETGVNIANLYTAEFTPLNTTIVLPD